MDITAPLPAARAGVARTPVLVTGLGPISAVGCGRDAFWDALIAGRHGFGPITLCDASRCASKVGAEVKDFRLDRFLPRGRAVGRRLPRPTRFALAAAALAMEDAGLLAGAVDRSRIGVAVGTSLGNAHAFAGAHDRWLRGEDGFGADAAFRLFSHGAACVLAAHFDLRGPVHTTTSGCNSGLDAAGYALRLLELGEADAVLVVGTDCELAPEILAMLAGAGALATRFNGQPGRASRPFDADRDGNVLGEGAAALVLESAEYAARRGARAYARMAAYTSCASGKRRYNAGSPEVDVDPSVRAFTDAIAGAGWRPSDVGAINANGSSSVVYDRVEALALQRAFGARFPHLPVHSIKSVLGQHGAGSSALQIVAACLTIARGVIPPTINYERPDPCCGPIRVVTEPEALGAPRILTHAIGFGGFYYSCGAFEAAA